LNPASVAEPAWQINEARSQEFVLAFISGGLFILIIGAGVLWIIRFQYPTESGPAVKMEAGGDRERQAIRHGLRLSGFVSISFSVLAAGAAWLFLDRLGIWSLALPVSILVVGLVFVSVSKRIV
jgi:hypothetical protein